MRDLIAQLRYAFRFLWRTPAFTVPAVASLALGIAVNTTIFSVFNATLLRPLGDTADGELVRIGRTARGLHEFRSLEYSEFLYLRTHATSFTDIAGHQIERVVMRNDAGTQVVTGEIVAGDYFALLGRPPLPGRSFDAESNGGFAAEAEAVISHDFWRSHFAADRGVIGRTVMLNDYPFTIVGVAAAGFHGTFPGVAVDVWLPAARVDAARPGTHERSLMLLGRLQPQVTRAIAHAELDVIARRLASADPQRDRDRTFSVGSARGVHPVFAPVLRVFLSLLLAVVGVVLLIACANVATLLLARASARRGELAVRLALGANRPQLMRQLLVECALLALVGGGTGVLLSIWPVHVLNSLSFTAGPTGAGLFFDLRLDHRVLLFTASVTMLTAVVFGVAPALQARRVNVLAVLQDVRMPGGARSGLRTTLVVVQVTLSFVLLVAAGLLFRGVRNTANVPLGFNPDQVLVASFDVQLLHHQPAQVTAFYAELLRRTRALPDVEHAAVADFVPLGDRGGHPLPLTVPDAPYAGGATEVPVGRVSDDYLTTIGQPLLRGRAFTLRDHAAHRVAIVNEAFARRYWQDQDALGRLIGLGEDGAEHEIVGVVRDARYSSYAGAVEPFVFLPAAGERQPYLHVRTGSLPATTAADIRRLAYDIDARVATGSIRPLREAMTFPLLPARIAQTVFGVAGIIALLLAAGGLYGLVCYTLEQRLKEVGIRVALGATQSDVFRVIVGSTLRIAVTGVVLGGVLAAATTRLLGALLYGLSPVDPLTFGTIAVLLLCLTLAAAYIAARRGLDVDPLTVLRHE